MKSLGIKELWNQTLGDPQVCIAILDGSVDLSHASLANANISKLKTLTPTKTNKGPALAHGTHVTSVIFGQHNGVIKGISPNCRGLVIPIFNNGMNDTIAPCSQLDLARAINLAVQEGADIINISGGELSPSGTAHPILADAVQNCADNNVLIIAAVGNDGCDCLHIPSALPTVLAVGAMNTKGQPLGFSNWGEQYQTQGILALGEDIPGASPGSGITTNSGTSYATPIVSGVVALLLSLQRKRGQLSNPHLIREYILNSADGCNEQTTLECRRLIGGRLNIQRAMTQINKGGVSMIDSTEVQQKNTSQVIDSTVLPAASEQVPLANIKAAISLSNDDKASNPISVSSTLNLESPPKQEIPINHEQHDAGSIKAAVCETCASASENAPLQLVFALGQLGFDFETEARRDSIMQHMDAPANPNDPNQLLAYCKKNPWEGSAILWTLNLDATPIYAIQAHGAFAQMICQRLCEFLDEQTRGEIERVSIPGYIEGSSQLSSGQVVPIIWPDLRGMYSWNNKALIESVCGKPPAEKEKQEKKDDYICKAESVTNFLQRVYEDLRNLGSTPQERAINYAATNAFQVTSVFVDAIQAEMQLDTIEVERSPICRLDSDCWDVKLTFFNPMKVFEQARKVYRFTVDVSDVVPVMVGSVRSWFLR